ncbi:MAG: glycoside hydrolase family 3 N-terminal domain-containing protein, partial [Planctomycetota bacterium]
MTEPLPYRDPQLPAEARVDDLLDRLELDEKLALLSYQGPAVERVGLPAYNWWNECLHGVARNGRATVFPQTIALAASFDRDLVTRVYDAIAAEARVKYAASALAGKRGQNRGLTFWTPNINIFRDPRWGRGQETFGECPHLTAQLASEAVRALQGDDPAHALRVAACAKHYAVHSGPELLRHSFDARPSPQDLWETYLPAFRALVDAGVEAVMGAYNRTLGEPCCGSRFLLQTVLREHWGFTGHVVSDCWAVRDFHEHHGVSASPEQSVAIALGAGCDLNCGCAYENAPRALARGLIDAAQVDRSLRRLLRCRLKLGQFDETPASLRRDAAACTVASAEHHALAHEAAVRGMVLLRNDGILPLRREAIDIFLTGPQAASLEVLLGNYHGLNGRLITVLEGVTAAVGDDANIFYKPGTLPTTANANPIDWISGEARAAEVVIAVCGIDARTEGEEGDAIASASAGDRVDCALPAHQREFLMRLTDPELQPTPVVLVLTGGSPISLGPLVERCAAVLCCWYPGEAGGAAVADVLFGAAAPAGRLPVTVPTGVEQLPPFEDYTMAGRTYRFMEAAPEFPFGFGLSYTRFAYECLAPAATSVAAGAGLSLE